MALRLYLFVLLVILDHTVLSQVPAFLVTQPEDVAVLPEHAASLTCAGYGLPPPSITWGSPTLGIMDLSDTNNNISARVQSSMFADSNGNVIAYSVLELCPAQSSQPVEYDVMCSVYNGDNQQPFGLTSATATVRAASNAAVIVVGTSSSDVVVGTRASLVCAAFGTPDPVISWSIESDSSDTVNINTTVIRDEDYQYTLSILELCDVSEDNSGQYTCTASNGVPGSTLGAAYTTFNITAKSTTTVTVADNSLRLLLVILIPAGGGLVVLYLLLMLLCCISAKCPLRNLFMKKSVPYAIDEGMSLSQLQASDPTESQADY